MSEWERGFAAGYAAHQEHIARRLGASEAQIEKAKQPSSRRRSTPKKRAASAYSKRYGRAFKRLAPKYKKKNGSWKKDGFKRCAAAARRKAKR